jgi:membrane protein YdbS with pleckstrin-like domain
MLGWIVRFLLLLAAPIAAVLVARDSLNFSLIQTFVAMFLLVAIMGLAAAWPTWRRPRNNTDEQHHFR